MPLPEFETVSMHRRSRILTVMLNRPGKLNAFDAVLHRELPQAISFASDDTDSDVVILTGAGRAFSAGGDMIWQQNGCDEPSLFETTVREAKQIIFGLIDCEKPVIAQINGPAVGLGATIALFCDISFMSESTYISDPHVSVGMVAGDGGAIIWPQLIGFARAKEYLLTGDRILAPDAAQMGLVNHAVPDDELDKMVNAFADRLARGAQQAIRYSKVTMNIHLRQLAASAMDVGLGYESVTNTSEDHREALRAFRDKREPCFASQRQT